jgi:CHAT domain-containing protein
MSLSVDEAIKNWTQRSIQTYPAIADAIQSLALAQHRSRSLDMLYQRSVLDSATERQAIANQISDVNAEIQALRAKLSEMGIRAADLSESQPLSISETQAVLEEGEKDKSYGWSVSRENATRFAIDSGERALRQKVDTLRRSLEAQQYGGSSAYATDVAHWLFEKFIRPGLVDHPDTKKLIIVPDGPLIGIPYPALRLSALPSIDSNGVDNSWLVAHYSVSLTPSVASLNSLRSRVSASQANRSFLGFGDPVLGEPPDDSATELESYTAYYDTRGLADPARLNSLKRLPESADELRELANLLEGSQDDIYLGENATETKFKNIRLRDFRVLAFATHGLLAGNIVGHGEPSLVMTPPTEATMFDDGLLSSSEIASLDLDADLVILSACDTASAGADADAMGLSGLTRAFFLAGSRNVLASNWPVNSDAARQLTTSMFEAMEAAPELSYPEALQLAMLQVINSAGTEVTRHPAYWAPFVVIGQ